MSRDFEVLIPGQYELAATLRIPEGSNEKYPLVEMVHGSGPTDRDSNAKGMPMNIIEELSEVVAAEGFASIRYDKRGVGTSKINGKRVSRSFPVLSKSMIRSYLSFVCIV